MIFRLYKQLKIFLKKIIQLCEENEAHLELKWKETCEQSGHNKDEYLYP